MLNVQYYKFRHEISSAEARLVKTNESLVTQISLSEKFLNNLERKNVQWQSCCAIVACLPDPPRVETTVRQGRMFSPSKEFKSEDDSIDGIEDRDDTNSENSSKWHCVWQGDSVSDKKKILDQLKFTFAKLEKDFGYAVCGLDAIDVVISRVDR